MTSLLVKLLQDREVIIHSVQHLEGSRNMYYIQAFVLYHREFVLPHLVPLKHVRHV